MVPHWLDILAIVSLVVAVAGAVLVAVDEAAGRAQRMWIMNLVWPMTVLWSGPLGLIAYYRVGRQSRSASSEERGGGHGSPASKPFWQSVGLGATHCGSGCALADLVVEWGVLIFPVVLFGNRVFGTWAVDFVAAFLIGIAFQYFTIAPMRDLSVKDGLVAAVKADTLSLVAWQLGMYGWMAVVLFAVFSPEQLPKGEPAFWFMMQIAMLAGFVTSYPVNWWLLRSGMKERM